jgi:sulfur carrier protein ThiS
MRVTVRYFGIVADVTKLKEQEIELPEGSTIANLLAHLATTQQGFAGIARQVRTVKNGQNSTKDDVLNDRDEIGLMRAIGGGG